jgi:hypothetical protein
LTTPCRRHGHSMVRAGTGHIEEENPSRHCQLHTEGRVIQGRTLVPATLRRKTQVVIASSMPKAGSFISTYPSLSQLPRV